MQLLLEGLNSPDTSLRTHMHIDPLPPNDLLVGFSDYRLDFLFEEQRCLRSICCVESLPRSLILTSVTCTVGLKTNRELTCLQYLSSQPVG